MRPDLWMGGNWAAEAQFGLWNPVNLAVSVFVALTPHIALAVTVVKVAFMELLALGAYALMREYGASAWTSVAVAAALPFAGFTLFFDAASWVAGLMALSWTPWFWWMARRCARGRSNPFLAYAIGFLVMTNGSPYGAIALVVVLAGLAVESLLSRNAAGLRRLVLVGACIGTVAGVAYLPMALTAGVGWRGDGASFGSTGELAPDLSMLAATSSPSLLPRVDMWGEDGSTVPIAFTLWFLLPILPWLRWSVLRRRARELSALLVVATVFLVIALGPSELWLFRWPIRLLQYVLLPAAVLLAVLASSGLQTRRAGIRLSASAALVLIGGWLAVAAAPELVGRHLVATVILLVLAGALGMAARRARLLPAVLVGGTAVVLALQLAWTPRNMDLNPWYLPTRVDGFQAFGRHPGPVIQVATDGLVSPADRPAAWQDLLFGSTPVVAETESTTSYTGIGFNAFSRSLCLTFSGGSCAPALEAAWMPAGTLVPVPHLADAVKARSILVQNALVPELGTLEVPSGWVVAEETERITVFQRLGETPWQASRLAAVSDGVRVASAAAASPTEERVRVSTPSTGGAVQFARLAWPGYAASVAGRPLEVRQSAQGLIELQLPGGLVGAEVRLNFSPPGYRLAIPLLLVGLGAAAVHGLWWRRRRRDLPPFGA